MLFHSLELDYLDKHDILNKYFDSIFALLGNKHFKYPIFLITRIERKYESIMEQLIL